MDLSSLGLTLGNEYPTRSKIRQTSSSVASRMSNARYHKCSPCCARLQKYTRLKKDRPSCGLYRSERNARVVIVIDFMESSVATNSVQQIQRGEGFEVIRSAVDIRIPLWVPSSRCVLGHVSRTPCPEEGLPSFNFKNPGRLPSHYVTFSMFPPHLGSTNPCGLGFCL